MPRPREKLKKFSFCLGLGYMLYYYPKMLTIISMICRAVATGRDRQSRAELVCTYTCVTYFFIIDLCASLWARQDGRIWNKVTWPPIFKTFPNFPYIWQKLSCHTHLAQNAVRSSMLFVNEPPTARHAKLRLTNNTTDISGP